jgi:GT2 family glycosyltransferase
MSTWVSVIIPTYNERSHVDALIENLLSQEFDFGQLEIIFADGMSTDGTKARLLEFAAKYPFIQVIDNPHKYVPQALNAALKIARGRTIIRLDAHSIYPQNYIHRLATALDELQVQNVGGVWITEPGAKTPEAQAIAMATSHPLGIGNASYRLGAESVKEVDTVPYGCFPAELFHQIGNFDTDLLRNQDDEFNGRIIRQGGKIMMLPDVKIRYFARPTVKKMRKMFFQYGQFKPLVNIKLGAPATLRQFAPPGLVMLMLVTILCLPFLPLVSALGALVFTIYALAIQRVSFQLVFAQKHTPKWYHPMSLVAMLGALIFYYTRSSWLGTGLSISVMLGILLMPTLLSLVLLNAQQRKTWLWLCICFPAIHFSYGFGYIFGWIQFVVLRSHKWSDAPLPSENR